MALQEWINSKYSSVVVDTVFVDQQSAIMQRYYLCSSSALTYSLQWSNLSYYSLQWSNLSYYSLQWSNLSYLIFMLRSYVETVSVITSDGRNIIVS
jgi:hypothetical protein